MTVHVLVTLQNPPSGRNPDIGDFDFLELPRVGEIITVTTRIPGGAGTNTAYKVGLVEQYVEVGSAPQATVFVTEE